MVLRGAVKIRLRGTCRSSSPRGFPFFFNRASLRNQLKPPEIWIRSKNGKAEAVAFFAARIKAAKEQGASQK